MSSTAEEIALTAVKKARELEKVVERQRQEIDRLRAALMPVITFPPEFKLTFRQSQILALLYKTSPLAISTERIGSIIYPQGCGPNIVHQLMLRLRRTIHKRSGIQIHSSRWVGYWITRDDKRKLANFLAERGMLC